MTPCCIFFCYHIHIHVLVIISKKLNTSVSPLHTQPDNGTSRTTGQNNIVRHIVIQGLHKNTGYNVGQIHFADSTATWKANRFWRQEKSEKIMYIKTLGCIFFTSATLNLKSTSWCCRMKHCKGTNLLKTPVPQVKNVSLMPNIKDVTACSRQARTLGGHQYLPSWQPSLTTLCFQIWCKT